VAFASTKHVISALVECKILTFGRLILAMKCVWRTFKYDYENNQKYALYRLIYYSKSALNVSGDFFAHHQEHLTAFTVSGSVHPSCCRVAAGSNLGEHYQIL